MSTLLRARSTCAAVLAGHIFLGTFTADSAGQGAQREAERSENIDDVVAEALGQSGAPGAIVAVVVHDSVALLRTYGRAGLEGDSPPDPGALFRVGAGTELINGIAAAALAQEGGSQLDASLGGIVSDLPDVLQDITVAQLLSHTAGIAYVPAVPGRGGADDLGAAARQLTRLDRLADPGAIYSPSLSGASLAGYALECAAGAPYADVIRIDVPARTPVFDLCSAESLQSLDIEADETAFRDRRTTQGISQRIYDAGYVGLRWWSVFRGEWHTFALYTERVPSDRLRFEHPEPLTLDHPALRETADELGIAI